MKTKTMTVRLPEELAAHIEAESRRRKVSKSDIVRERLSLAHSRRRPAALDAISDLIGSVDELPASLSTQKKKYLKATRYGQKRPR